MCNIYILQMKPHRTCQAIIMDPKERLFLKTWEKETNKYGSLSYGHVDTSKMTETFVGLTMKQLVSKEEWSSKMCPVRGQLLFHRMMIVKGIRCPDCLDPVFMLDAVGNGLSSLQCQTDFWTRNPVRDELALVHNAVPEDTMPNAADTLGFWAWHLHHMNMSTNHPAYIMPSSIPKYTLPFGTLPSDDNEPVVLEEGSRLWHYSLLQTNCNQCHEQGENRKYWTVDMAYTSPVSYDVPSHPKSVQEVLGGDKYQTYKSYLDDYNLDNQLRYSTITFEELNAICVNELDYRVKDLVTFDKEVYETTEYTSQRKRFMKMIALNFVKKESGLCIGREGASICPSRDIRNILPRRLNGIHGDHGEGAGKKKFSPSDLVGKTWTEFDAELVKLDGMRCGHCHRGK